MPKSRRHLQWIGCSALVLVLAGCADSARWGDAKVWPGERPQCLVGEDDSALPPRADGLALSQRRQRRHPQPSLRWSGERPDTQPMQVDFRQHDE
ncbi:hypothetical protein [Xanthomonas translucens]|uniref:hypothetical protein n=1 Tax=Xanthomonas campestris pv. translucens TaxID=343 RepID=UPI00071E9C63|nr:hypothetical protein [Xanthomonas translucens]KTF30228.1 hypothetical protein OZ12_19650 [Xanthomonas translucens pv. translucens]KWV12480.1 hypothetical protein ATB54_15785 [Xanthomonas translucens]MCS3361189.1 hypothetical protein [Xanthomonas translucens pv. translucens]MCS3373949.1 hypothetical protein [Xanthomonas translucens pv. translucens]MCT8274618.1 hypothetical protein [Xanthomonas translucens pv. translucens]